MDADGHKKLTINGGTFNPLNGGAYVLLNSKGTLTINGGTFGNSSGLSEVRS